jgi:hypothetical protein
MGLVEDDSVRVDVDAAGINAGALGLDECDAMLHRCTVFLLDVKKVYVTNVALVESGVVEVEHAFWTLYEYEVAVLGIWLAVHVSQSQIMVSSCRQLRAEKSLQIYDSTSIMISSKPLDSSRSHITTNTRQTREILIVLFMILVVDSLMLLWPTCTSFRRRTPMILSYKTPGVRSG